MKKRRSDRGIIRMNVNDIIGKRLGKLEVISYAGHRYDNTKGGERLRHCYVVQCDCGTVKTITRGPIVSEIVHSCGCDIRRGRHGN